MTARHVLRPSWKQNIRTLMMDYGLMAWEASDLLADLKVGGPDSQALTFTPGMAKVAGQTFAAAPLVQGHVDGSAGDVVAVGRGAQISGSFYANLDAITFTLVGNFRTEWAGDDGVAHYLFYSDADFYLLKNAANALVLRYSGTNYTGPSVSWAAGSYNVIAVSLSTIATIDGTNYVRFSVEDAHTYTGAAQPTADTPAATLYIGSDDSGQYSVGAIAEGLTIYRRVLFDGTYGTDVGNGDELALIYNSGTYKDPCEVTGSWDACFCAPTNATTGALATGTGEAWSHPHASNALTDGFAQTAYAGSAWADEGTPVAVEDMSTSDPTDRVYGWGYAITSDAANEGINQPLTGLAAGANYVCRPVIGYPDTAAQPQIIAYDATNGAAISTFPGPFLEGTHDGAGNSATLIDSTVRWPQSLVGGTVANTTDGSSGTITAISGDMTTITATLSGGTDNDWDAADAYTITPPSGWVWCEPFCFELPTNARNGVGSDCTALTMKVINADGSSQFYLHQIELLANLMDNPSLETGAGDPWLASGWTNENLPVGGTEAEAAIVHSGAGSIQYNAGALDNQRMRFTTAIAANGFYGLGLWVRGEGSVGLFLGSTSAEHNVLQRSSSLRNLQPLTADAWTHEAGVYRNKSGTAYFAIYGATGAGAARYGDDAYLVALTAVSLTVTPATEANSRESMTHPNWGAQDTMRVDGRDTLTIPTANVLQADRGSWMGWRRFRRATAWTNETILDMGGASPNEFRIVRVASTNVIHVYYGDQNDATTDTIADTSFHCLALTWTGDAATLYIDAASAAGFSLSGAATPTLVATGYLGSNASGALQAHYAIASDLISKRAWSAGTVAQLYNLTRPHILGDA